MVIQCVVCGKELSGGIDTFGDQGLEMCWDCYSGLFEDANLQVAGIVGDPLAASDNVLIQMIGAGGAHLEAAKDDPKTYNYEID